VLSRHHPSLGEAVLLPSELLLFLSITQADKIPIEIINNTPATDSEPEIAAMLSEVCLYRSPLAVA